ncbi:MAG: FIST C-terminal domain-containing protein, partial [Oscillospiraceae bacterium]|nr:FIST C-terminal domain-containing protein [Oscillospiraceae bacterium]
MIKMLNAFSEDPDNIEDAVDDLLAQLDIKHNLLKNSVAIVYCHIGFTDAEGVYELLNSKLPFDTVGMTAVAMGGGDNFGQIAISVSVLTSDDAEFFTTVSPSLEKYSAAEVTKIAVDNITAAVGNKPVAMYYPFVPFDEVKIGVSPEEYINALNNLVTAPVFGGVASSDEADFFNSFTLHNGKRYIDSLVLFAAVGDFTPEFYTLSLTYENIGKTKANITKSKGAAIFEVNDKPVLEYFTEIGLYDSTDPLSLLMTPLVFYMGDGTSVVRSVLTIAEDGALILASSVPENGEFCVGLIHHQGVIDSAQELLTKSLKSIGDRAALFVSCAGRLWVLGTDFGAEREVINANLKNNKYNIAYAGGEVYPEKSIGLSRVQNETLIV